MKTRTALHRTAMIFTAVFLFVGIQTVFAGKAQEALEKRVEGVISRYYPQDFEIKVLDEGTVRIRGEVNTLYDRLRIFDIVSKVEGVKKIKNELVVQTPIVADKMIEADLVQLLNVNKAISEPDRIKVHVDNGIVFLSGEVNFYREKLAARTTASWEKGVKGIVDEIEVVPHPAINKSDQKLQEVLQDILEYQFPNEKNVAFTIQDGVVTLMGKTRVLWTQHEIVKEFSSIMGVKKVINKMKLGK